METYVDKTGGLIVEKVPAPEPVAQFAEPMVMSVNPVSVHAEDTLDAIQSYLPGSFGYTDASKKGECVICGKQTAYMNRKICLDCFEKYSKEIIDGLKSAVQDVDFSIE